MAIIKRRQKVTKTIISASIDETLAAQLRGYSEWTNITASEIVEAAVRHVIEADKEFLQVEFNRRSEPEAIEQKPKTPEKAA